MQGIATTAEQLADILAAQGGQECNVDDMLLRTGIDYVGAQHALLLAACSAPQAGRDLRLPS